MSKEIVALFAVILVSMTGSAYAIDPIFSNDRTAGFSFEAIDLRFTCPDGTSYDDASTSIQRYSSERATLDFTTGNILFVSAPNTGMVFDIFDGLNDGEYFKFTGIIYDDNHPKNMNDRTSDGQCCVNCNFDL